MKLSTILCGAAAVALLATSAQATNYGGGHGGGGGGGGGGNPSTPSTGTSGTGPWGEYATTSPLAHPDHHNWDLATDPNANQSRWAAKKTSQSNIGTAGTRDGAKFSLTGKVTPHCVFYTGDTAFGGTLKFDIGTIGIYASENHSLATAFDQVDGAKFHFSTNVAGCNAVNRVVLSSTKNALVADYGNGYDQQQFTKELPFTVTAKFKPVRATGHGQNTFNQTLTLTGNTLKAGEQDSYGAWKSPLEITVNVGHTNKSLVAGNYSGGFEIVIETL
jgi:hypothetical protein